MRLFVFAAVALDEGIESGFRALPSLRYPDVVQRALGLAVHTVRQLVEHVGVPVHPVTLRPRGWPYLVERLPQAERAVADGQLRPRSTARAASG
jgi:hypothetical protein